jgi:anhydro-N-acetylmuramic acid kinase
MLIDATTQLLFGRPYDRNGAIAREGAILPNVLASAIRHPFFRRKPPKSAGREQFGSAFAADFIASCKSASPRAEDAVATATALTASSIRSAYQHFVLPLMGRAPVDYLLSGGGAKNETLATMIEHELSPLGCRVGITDNLGLPAQAKEAVAFALLSYETWHRRPGNVPSATGARHPAILGDITYA